MSTDLPISLISAAVALSSAGLSLYGIRLANRLQGERENQNKEQKAEELVARYRDPLLRAGFDLQSRLFNIVRQEFLTVYYIDGKDVEREYAVENTLYVLGQYLGWVEILRQDVQFLDLRNIELNAKLVERLEAISSCLLTDTIRDPVMRLFSGEQRAIGEVMASATDGNCRREVIGYATFVTMREDAAFSRWFALLQSNVIQLADEPGIHDERLVELQHRLVDLIEFLDPDAEHFPRRHRTKI